MAEELEKTRTTVDIYDEQYNIVGYESTSHVRMVASIVDDKMREIKAKNPYLDTKKLAVLTAVNIVNEYLKAKNKLEKLEEKQKDEGHL
ncbi:cell division protein ZapA [Bacillus taeanensis]|uniref:Cell division protein ZapA n=1 Tax=Bacillus taeanensis TaxID=273032 RepID=A0A366Y010_9BACI|nr:cell division protein ZapA [Bacillus taeanensis]RBW71527.1 cell division protein ZapA [Bacillus taeanensis]